MRRQPPEDNNPANPLFKVAALEITKQYAGANKRRHTRIKIKLNFKKSNNMRGSTTAIDNKTINVVFELSLRNATLELSCVDDRFKSLSGVLQFGKVAYTKSLLQVEDMQEKKSIRTKKSRSGGGGIQAKVKTSLVNLIPDVATNANSKTEMSRIEDKSISTVRKMKSLNVSVTHTDTEINWEIRGNSIGPYDASPNYLEGSLFTSACGSKIFNACTFKRIDDGSLSNVVVTASLMVSTKDLILGGVSFTDNDGFPVDWRSIRPLGKGPGLLRDIMSQNDAKERLIKEIIRKHLLDQGMKTFGDLVEICRASV